MNQRKIKILERILKKRWIGSYVYNKSLFRFERSETTSMDYSVVNILINRFEVNIIINESIDNDEHFDFIWRWHSMRDQIQKEISDFLNKWVKRDRFKVRVLYDSDPRRFVKEFREQYLGDHRYMNHSFRIVKINHKQGHPTADIEFEMKRFRGDRSFIFDRIKFLFNSYRQKYFPRVNLDVTVRMRKL